MSGAKSTIYSFGELARYFLKLNAVKVNHRNCRLLSGGQSTVAALTAVVRFFVRVQG